jgi:acetyltransferase-like isoleucine patch superfamily enzyme
MHNLVTHFIQKTKRDSDYHLDPGLTTLGLANIIGERLLQALRGSLYKLRFKQSQGFIFVGKGVIIRNPRLIETGRNLTIKDFASIQALSRKGIQFGDNVMIGRYTIIECTGVIRELGEGLRVGNNSNFGDYNFIGVRGPVEIGNDVLFGPRVSIHAENHIFERLDVPIRKQGTSRRGVKIEDDCWIGSGVIVTDGVTIGRGSVIAAGSVVTRDIPPFSVAAGVPARVIKQRNNKEGTTR